MYQIIPELATHGIPQEKLEMSYNEAKFGEIDGFEIVDVRMLKDGDPNPDKDYLLNIIRVISWLDLGRKVVICCSAGQSRSNAIALGVLVRYYKMDFWKAWELIKEKVPIADIDMMHIAALKRLFKVTVP